MSDSEIREAIAAAAEEAVGWTGVLPSGDLSEHLDSLQRLSLVVAIEDRLRVCLDFDAAEATTIDDLVRLLRERLRQRDGGEKATA